MYNLTVFQLFFLSEKEGVRTTAKTLSLGNHIMIIVLNNSCISINVMIIENGKKWIFNFGELLPIDKPAFTLVILGSRLQCFSIVCFFLFLMIGPNHDHLHKMPLYSY